MRKKRSARAWPEKACLEGTEGDGRGDGGAGRRGRGQVRGKGWRRGEGEGGPRGGEGAARANLSWGRRDGLYWRRPRGCRDGLCFGCALPELRSSCGCQCHQHPKVFDPDTQRHRHMHRHKRKHTNTNTQAQAQTQARPRPGNLQLLPNPLTHPALPRFPPRFLLPPFLAFLPHRLGPSRATSTARAATVTWL